MGLFVHEAAAVDPDTNLIYQTEDRSDGGFYRFRPTDPAVGGRPDLGSGTLEIAIVTDLPSVLAGGSSTVSWANVPNPAPSNFQTSTRKQVAGSTRFYRGEGAWYANGFIYFATTGRSSQPWEQRVWAYEVATDLSLIHI